MEVKTNKNHIFQKGFTLLELLLVITLISILITIGVTSFNTSGRFAEARNDVRKRHIQTIENALTQYKLRTGNYPTGLDRTYREICDPDASSCSGFLDLKQFLVPNYLQAIPQDPNDSDNTGGAGYSLAVDVATNTISVRALSSESGIAIAVNDPLPTEETVVTNSTLAATVPGTPPTPPSGVVNFNITDSGLYGQRFVGYYADNVSFFDTAPKHGDTSLTSQINSFTSNADSYSWQWVGYFKAPTTGSYTFFTSSDDASHLWIGSNAVSGFTTANATVNNGGLHATIETSGTVSLTAGEYYPVRIMFGESGGGDIMTVSFSGPSIAKTANGTGYFFGGQYFWDTYISDINSNSNNIVTNGLALYLDAGNSASYPGTGTTWYDLSWNRRHYSLGGSIAWNSSGFLQFSGGTATGPASNSFGFNTNAEHTILSFLKINTPLLANNFFNWVATPAIGTDTRAINTHFPWSDGVLYYDVAGCCRLNQRMTSATADDYFLSNVGMAGWRTRVSQTPNRQFFNNTTSVADSSTNSTGTVNWNLTNSATMGGGWNGNIYVFMVYNRALTDLEIQQNFNFFKTRFGL